MTPSHRPRVSVLTAVRNGEAYLDAAIASVVAQTYTDFEYIVVDDGSTDNTHAILSAWAARDARIRLLHNARSLGACVALNPGLAEAKGEYVAILDGDDIAYPTRLAEQVAFLDANPSIGLVGSQVMSIDAAGNEVEVLSFPTVPALAHWRFFFQIPVLHSAAMMRRSLVEQVGGYSLKMRIAGDYDLFARMAQVTEISNLPTTLVAYRQSLHQISKVHRRAQLGQVFMLLQAMLLDRYGFDKSRLPAIAALYHGVRGEALLDEETLIDAGALLVDLYHAYVLSTALRDEERQRIAEDCAWFLLLLAWVHRHAFRAASRRLLARGQELDPQLWTRAQTWLRLRAMYKRLRQGKD